MKETKRLSSFLLASGPVLSISPFEGDFTVSFSIDGGKILQIIIFQDCKNFFG